MKNSANTSDAAGFASVGRQTYDAWSLILLYMRRRDYLVATGSAVISSAFAGCIGGDGGNGDDGGDETGMLATRVTDQPGDIADFESCVVTITEIRLKPSEEGTETEEGDDDDEDEGTPEETATPEETETEAEDTEAEDEDEDEGEVVYEIDSAEADLVELQDGNTQLVDEREIETDEYEYMKLTVSEVNGTLKDGSDTEVDTPGNAPLKFNESFEIRANTRTTFTADFTPVKRGQQNSYILQPVASGVEVSYEDVEADESTEEATDEQTEEPTEA